MAVGSMSEGTEENSSGLLEVLQKRADPLKADQLGFHNPPKGVSRMEERPM